MSLNLSQRIKITINFESMSQEIHNVEINSEKHEKIGRFV